MTKGGEAESKAGEKSPALPSRPSTICLYRLTDDTHKTIATRYRVRLAPGGEILDAWTGRVLTMGSSEPFLLHQKVLIVRFAEGYFLLQAREQVCFVNYDHKTWYTRSGTWE